MAKVNVEEEIKKAEKAAKIESESGIQVIELADGRKLFKGQYVADPFNDYDECIRENQRALTLKTNKELGLNELGQTPEQAAQVEKARPLLLEMTELDKKKTELAVRINRIRAGLSDVVDAEKEVAPKARKNR